jgi:hypothetical protein
MPQISINPNQIYRIKTFTLFLSIAILFTIISFILLIIFCVRIKSETTVEGDKIYLPNNKSVLYASIVSSILGFFPLIYCLIKYHYIFKFEGSKTLYFISGLLFILFFIFIVDVIFLAKKFNFCPDGYEFSSYYKQCVPICNKGSYLGSNKQCLPGCKTDGNCLSGYVCVNGNCCNILDNTVIDGECCPNENVKKDDTGKDICCPLVCGEECCQNDKDFECTTDDSGKKYCGIKCGDNVCSNDEYCFQYPSSLDPGANKNNDGYSYKCSKFNKDCTMGDITYNPSPVNNFYTAYDANIASPPPFNDFLNKTPQNQKAFIDAYSTNPTNKSNSGYLCGMENVIQLQSVPYKNCTDFSKCLDLVQYPITEKVSVVDSDGTMYCNYIKNPNKTVDNLNQNESDPNSVYTKISTNKTNNYVSKNTKQVPFITGDDPDPTNTIVKNNLNSANEDNCQQSGQTTALRYTKLCDQDCVNNNECPISDTASSSFSCTYKKNGDNNYGYVQDAGEEMIYVCGIENGKYGPIQIKAKDNVPPRPVIKSSNPEQECQDYLDEASKNTTGDYMKSLLGDNYKKCYTDPGKCPGGGVYFYNNNQCPLNKVLFDQKDNIKFCPPGTNPFLYQSGYRISQGKDCYAYAGNYGDAAFVCCDNANFDISKANNNGSSLPSKDTLQYCIDQNSITYNGNKWKNGYPMIYFASGKHNILQGAVNRKSDAPDDMCNDPTSCDISDSSSGLPIMKKYYKDLNNYLWGGGPSS